MTLPEHLREAMFDHARERPGEEICGLLGARAGALQSLYRVANVAADRARAFAMAPQGQIGALRAMREAGETLGGIYHSHPRGPPAPSAADLAQAAYPWVAYFIIALAHDPPLAAWVFDGETFVPLPPDWSAAAPS